MLSLRFANLLNVVDPISIGRDVDFGIFAAVGFGLGDRIRLVLTSRPLLDKDFRAYWLECRDRRVWHRVGATAGSQQIGPDARL